MPTYYLNNFIQLVTSSCIYQSVKFILWLHHLFDVHRENIDSPLFLTPRLFTLNTLKMDEVWISVKMSSDLLEKSTVLAFW